MKDMTVAELFARHMEDMDERIAIGKLAQKTRGDYARLCRLMVDVRLDDKLVSMLKPENFSRLMGVIESHGHSLRTQKNIVASVKTVFNWGGPDGMGYVPRIGYGKRFCPPSRREIEAEQENKSPSRFIDREVILAMLEAASTKMKVAILLGINCGFYPSDTIAICHKHLHLDGDVPYHDFRRVKTLQQRRAVLWPETIEAISLYAFDRPHYHLDDKDRWPTVLLNNARKAYSPTGDKLAGAFQRLLLMAGVDTPGVGLGSLRHTYATIIDPVPDQAMKDLTMGHTSKSIQERTYRQLNVDEFARLQVIANTVRQWLFDPQF